MSEASQVEICEVPLKCAHCRNETFHVRRSMLNSRTLALLQLELFNDSASSYICARCGHMMWFFDLPANAPAPPREPMECLSCHAVIPAASSTCPACGWSYEADIQSPISP